jgi:hypothetical protein
LPVLFATEPLLAVVRLRYSTCEALVVALLVNSAVAVLCTTNYQYVIFRFSTLTAHNAVIVLAIV